MGRKPCQRGCREQFDNFKRGTGVLHLDERVEKRDHIKPFVRGIAQATIVEVVAVNVDRCFFDLIGHDALPRGLSGHEKTALKRFFRPKPESTK